MKIVCHKSNGMLSLYQTITIKTNNIMTQEQRDEIKALNIKFNELHAQLMLKGEYALAEELSAVYYQSQTVNYHAGIDLVKNLYNL